MPVKAEILKVARTALHRVALALDSHIPISRCSYCCEVKPFKAFPRHMTTSQDCYKCFRTNRGRVVCKLCLAHRVPVGPLTTALQDKDSQLQDPFADPSEEEDLMEHNKDFETTQSATPCPREEHIRHGYRTTP